MNRNTWTTINRQHREKQCASFKMQASTSETLHSVGNQRSAGTPLIHQSYRMNMPAMIRSTEGALSTTTDVKTYLATS